MSAATGQGPSRRQDGLPDPGSCAHTSLSTIAGTGFDRRAVIGVVEPPGPARYNRGGRGTPQDPQTPLRGAREMMNRVWLTVAPLVLAAAVTLVACGCGKEESGPSVKPPAPVFVNARCPIMGTLIDPAKTTPDLIRMFRGQKVAFCCGSCPAAWDKLSPAEKDAKLKAATEAK